MTPNHGPAAPLKTLRFRSHLGGAGLFLLLALFAGCAQEPPSTPLERSPNSPDQIIWEFTTSASDSGQLSWTFTGDKALIFKQGREVEAEGVRIDMYSEARERSSTLTSDSGWIDRRGGNMTAFGNVHVISREDYELWTDTLHWDQDREIFHTEAFVKVQQDQNLYSGYEMECDKNLDHLSIKREFEARVVQAGELDD